ncbi:hypothetical protein BH11CYA1_BH11CYA1_44060 [soil metagenome]
MKLGLLNTMRKVTFIIGTIFALTYSVIAIGDTTKAYGVDGNWFKDGMLCRLIDIDQRTLRPCDGDLFGLNKEDGRVVLKPKYSDIEYSGHGIFLATDVQKSNKYYFGDERHFF